MKKRTITMCFYGPTDVDEVSISMMVAIDGEVRVSTIQTQIRTVYYGHSLSMLKLYMVGDINIIDKEMSIHKGTLVRVDPTSDNPYVIEVNGKEESFPFIGMMIRD